MAKIIITISEEAASFLGCKSVEEFVEQERLVLRDSWERAKTFIEGTDITVPKEEPTVELLKTL